MPEPASIFVIEHGVPVERPIPEVASARAFELLKASLSPSQAEEYAKHSHFTVTGSHTGRSYRIVTGSIYNIVGENYECYCAKPKGLVLYGDVMLEIDWSVGEILRALRETGAEANTLVVFTSDNGPWISYGNHAGKTPYREAKGTGFDGGTRSAITRCI